MDDYLPLPEWNGLHQDGYRDGDGMVIRLMRWQGRYLVSLDIEPQPNGKGTLYAQEVWIWLEERGVVFKRDAAWDFYSWISENLSFEFRMRWL